jgi:hypothetical protein
MKNAAVDKGNFIRHKIFHRTGYNPTYKSRTALGVVDFIYEHPHKLVFKTIKYRFESGKARAIKGGGGAGILTCKNGSFNLYKIGGEGAGRTLKNISTCPRLVIEKFAEKLNGKKTKAGYARVSRILRKFAKRNGVNLPRKKTKEEMIALMLYPAIRELENTPTTFEATYSKHLRQPTFRKAVSSAFGKGDKVYKMVCEWSKANENDLNVLELSLLKGLIPIDYFFKLIAEYRVSPGHPKHRIFLRKILKSYNAKRILTLLGDKALYRSNELINDMCLMYSIHGDKIIFPEKPLTLRVLHDDMARQTRRMANPVMEFKVRDKIKALNGSMINENLKLIVPQNSHDLIEWATIMSNCISNYSHQMKNNDVLLLGVEKNGVMTYNISVRNGHVEQFYGARNSDPDQEDKKVVKSFLEKNDVILKDYVAAVAVNNYIWVDELLNNPVPVAVHNNEIF